MATERVNLKQTAVNAAASVVAAEYGAGLIDSVQAGRDRFKEVAQAAFEELLTEFEQPSQSGASGSGASASGGGGGSAFSLEDALDTTITFGGKFVGKTLREVADMSASEAEANHDYTTGPGIKYIEWLSGNERNNFLMQRAQAILDARKAATS